MDDLAANLAALRAVKAAWEKGLEVEKQREVLLDAVQDMRRNFLRLELDYRGLGKDPWWIAFKQQILDSYERVKPEYPNLKDIK